MQETAEQTPQRLPRAAVIRKRAILYAHRRRMRRLEAAGFILYAGKVDTAFLQADGAVAFLTPKAVGNAVARQRVRRWMREVFRREIPWRAQSVRWIWVARPSAVKLGFDALREEMLKAAAQIASDA